MASLSSVCRWLRKCGRHFPHSWLYYLSIKAPWHNFVSRPIWLLFGWRHPHELLKKCIPIHRGLYTSPYQAVVWRFMPDLSFDRASPYVENFASQRHACTIKKAYVDVIQSLADVLTYKFCWKLLRSGIRDSSRHLQDNVVLLVSHWGCTTARRSRHVAKLLPSWGKCSRWVERLDHITALLNFRSWGLQFMNKHQVAHRFVIYPVDNLGR